MITILYPYRNRELERIKRSLDSLAQQTNLDFKVIFVDYGSNIFMANQVAELIKKYSFVQYHYLDTFHQPWNKSKALNYAIKKTDSDFCFIADIDMIFHPEFIKLLLVKSLNNTVTFFKVGFLSEYESLKILPFEDYKIKFHSNQEATGMSLLPIKNLKDIHGYDEFFHFWGAEDTDLHNRLCNAGCAINYYDEKTLMLHQWHPNYRQRETKTLNRELQIKEIVEINHRHLVNNLERNLSKVNLNSWGEVISKNDFDNLINLPVTQIFNEVAVMDHFLFVELFRLISKEKISISILILEHPNCNSVKNKIKKRIGKKVPRYYSLKEINDQLLLHIISFYHHLPYIYHVSPDLKSISFAIQNK
jgi:glycosyltransferase involved in cell wall biosynthesis